MMTPHLPHPTRAMAVANWFLEKSWATGIPCDQMKLYKLVYYAHAWYLGNGKGELFPEDIEAWPHGPVVRDLYGEFREFRAGVINRLGKRLEIDEQGATSFVNPKHDGSLDDFFGSVWEAYKAQTGIQLSNGTHEAGEPWNIVASNYDFNLSSKPTISSEVIHSVFSRKVANAQRSA